MGGQALEKVTERHANTGYQACVAAFILDEAGIVAAGDNEFDIQWNHTPSRTPGYGSVFFGNVNQSRLVGAKANAATTSATAATDALATQKGEMILAAATCGNTGSYTLNNGFAKAIELSISSADGVAGSKTADGANETASVTHSAANRQSVIGLVLQAP